MITRSLFLLLAAAAMLGCAKEPEVYSDVVQGQDCNEPADGSFFKGWIRIKLQDGVEPLNVGVFTRGNVESGNSALDEVAAGLGATEVRRTFNDGGRFAERRRRYGFHLWYDLRIDDTVSVSRAGSRISSLPGIEYVEPIHKIFLVDNPQPVPAEIVYTPASYAAMRPLESPFNDPEITKQWHYNNDGTMARSVEGADINLFEAWKTTAGNREVIVAINDFGIQWDHPDLAANMWVNEAELNGTPGVDDDGNGFIDDIYGWNTQREDGVINPGRHGTHVAGTVAAVNNNGIGVCGVAGGTGNGDGVRLMSCQIMDEQSAPNHAEAFLYAADNGAVISQNSWAYSDSNLPATLSYAFDYFIENAGMDDTDGDGKNDVQKGPMKGGVIIFSAANDGRGIISTPANDPRVLAVTAMGPDYKKASYSNYGVEADIFAPGGLPAELGYPAELGVYSTDLTGYCYISGTSMACPHVSGVAALVVSQYGAGKTGFTADDLKERVLRSYRPVNEYVNEEYLGKLGVGLIDAGLIFLDDPGTAPAVIESPESSAAKNEISFSWLASDDGNNMPVAVFSLSYTGKGVGTFAGREDISGVDTLRNYVKAGERMSYSMTGNYNTEYSFEVKALDRFGNASEKTGFSCTTEDYNNKKPTVSKRFGNIEVENVGEEYNVEFKLSRYFTDTNFADGDVLTYTLINRNEEIVKASIDDEKGTLLLKPVAKGTANITVTATDLDGEAIQNSMTLVVLNGPDGPVDPDQPPVTPGEGSMALYPIPAGETLSILLADAKGSSVEVSVYDPAARKVIGKTVTIDDSGLGTLDVSALSPGTYNLSATRPGDRWNAAFVKK